ncbi:hypothetical protein GALL_215390 [mine drainage metagenome]|uniref:Type 4 fimbrial biogenesis protein PilX N-terminal domain-containing protein n=1 Tax=mine drainage metagenome TaxID=410659 RepID=A0A1J5RLW3_9ZZZZ
MNSLPKASFARMRMNQQRGVVLFFALIALLAMSLAAVALIRSVDTNSIIAGNLSFKRAATTAGDAGVEAAITWLATIDAANSGINVYLTPTHPFNVTGGAGNPGYYSNLDPTVSLTNGTGIKWSDTDSKLVTANDTTGNQVRYVIQRMCRIPNSLIGPAANDCLFSGAVQSNGSMGVQLPQDVCNGPGCPVSGQSPMYSITSQTIGPKFTVSYVQAFVY